tara:strand:- start:4521 stop:4748 length:228 start_codon:yes stop_codon:yes gene_type:complete
MIVIAFLIPFFFIWEGEDFFKLANKQMEQGAKWHYVGSQALSPPAKSLPLQCVDENDVPCSEPFILWKLKNEEGD